MQVIPIVLNVPTVLLDSGFATRTQMALSVTVGPAKMATVAFAHLAVTASTQVLRTVVGAPARKAILVQGAATEITSAMTETMMRTVDRRGTYVSPAPKEYTNASTSSARML